MCRERSVGDVSERPTLRDVRINCFRTLSLRAMSDSADQRGYGNDCHGPRQKPLPRFFETRWTVQGQSRHVNAPTNTYADSYTLPDYYYIVYIIITSRIILETNHRDGEARTSHSCPHTPLASQVSWALDLATALGSNITIQEIEMDSGDLHTHSQALFQSITVMHTHTHTHTHQSAVTDTLTH